MKHLYFFTSSNTTDEISGITVFANSVKKAFALANIHFKNNEYIGHPQMLAI